MTKYDYIPTEFGRTWVASRTEARRGVFTPLSYIDINEGNRYDGDVFAQIMYWHEPNTETGEPRLTRQKDGNYWLTKNHGDWFRETRIKLQTVRKCLERLKERSLIVYELGGEQGNVTPWIRVNWDEFERRIKLWIENNVANISEKDYESILGMLYHTPVTREHTPCYEITEQVLPENIPLLPEVKSNTEITSKTELDFALDSHTPAPNGLGNPETLPPQNLDTTNLTDFYATLEAKTADGDKPPVAEAIDGKLPIVTPATTPPTPSSAAPPSPLDALDMAHLRDVVANKWFGFTSPKYTVNAPAKTQKKIDDIVSVVIVTFPDATDDRFAWAALEFCKHWSTKKDQGGKPLSLPMTTDTFGTHWRRWLLEHPEIAACMNPKPAAITVDDGPTEPVENPVLFGGKNVNAA